MDLCPKCGVAMDVRAENGGAVFLCRNPRCEQYGKPISQSEEKGSEKNG